MSGQFPAPSREGPGSLAERINKSNFMKSEASNIAQNANREVEVARWAPC